MASRLSSLLVRDGLVGVKRMEKAFQRQVIYGGSLDTILLEMNLVPEDRLSQYLALASGLPPATRAETNVFDAEAVRRCAEDLALRFRVVPLAVTDGALRVLVYDPVDMALLEDLADALDLPVQPLIVPEYRWHMVYTRAYGGTLPARFGTLAKLADTAPVTAPVGRARTVIIDAGTADAGTDHEVVDVAPDGAVERPRGLGGETLLRPVGPEARTMRMDAVMAPEVPIEARIPADEVTPPQVPLPRVRTRELTSAAREASATLRREEPPRSDDRQPPGTAQVSPPAEPATRPIDEAVPLAIDGDAARRTEATTGRARRTLPGVPAAAGGRSQSGPIPLPAGSTPSGRVPVVGAAGGPSAGEAGPWPAPPRTGAAADARTSARLPTVTDVAPSGRDASAVEAPPSEPPASTAFDLAPTAAQVPARSEASAAAEPALRADAARQPPEAAVHAAEPAAKPRRAGTEPDGRVGTEPGVEPGIRVVATESSGRDRRADTARPSEGLPPGDGPITPVAAREALNTADERDEIFRLLLRAIRSRARWAGLLTVQGGAAIGRLALAEPGLDTDDIASVLLPLDARSAFRTAIIERRHVIGPIATSDPDIDNMVARMGGAVPPSALLLPIVLRDRVVALAIGHRVDRAIGLGDVAELLPLAQVAADAVGRLIVRHKSLGYRAPTANPAPDIASDELPQKRAERTAGGWSVPSAASVPELDHATLVEINAEPPRPIAEVLGDVDGADDERAADALEEAVARAAEVLPLLGARFPGRLRIDRYQVSGRALRAAQYGGLLGMIVRIGPPAADLLVEKMGDAHRDVRFYAAVCTAETRPRNALYALVERLFDTDYAVRAVAIDALAGYPARDLDLAMVRARHALHGEDPDRVQAAAGAIAALADIHAVPDLLDTLGRDDRRAEYARRALTSLTKQDFGVSERKWRRWWEDHRLRHRIEWMIEGLGHKEATLRQSALDDLRRLTGDDLGYHPELPRRERDLALTRWRTWWADIGRRRFSSDDERHRPTAVLPPPRR